MDKDKPTHSYNTRSKGKSKRKNNLNGDDIKTIRNSKKKIGIEMKKKSHSFVEKNVSEKPTFKDSDSDSDYDPKEELEYLNYLKTLEDESNLKIHLSLCKDDDIDDNDVDEHGNVKGLIDYDYETQELEEIKQTEMLYSMLTKTLIDALDKPITTEPSSHPDKSSETTTERYTKRNLYKNYNLMERTYYESLDKSERDEIFNIERSLIKDSENIPIRFKILKCPFSSSIKRSLLEKVNIINNIDKSSGEYYKLKKWVDGIMRIPFGKYIEPRVNKHDDSAKITEYLNEAYKTLDSAVYGHHDAKTEIMLLISKWISNPSSHGNVIGILGPPGNGKTTLVRKGISKAIDKPFAFITLGGATDASFLEGHSYTYEGSVPGRIVEILGENSIDCMNPIFYFDELDKVSDTARGHEIHNILCHLTDFSQNDAFHDKYYSGIDFDLSKSLFVFSFNDIELINPILRDRMTIIKTHGFDKTQKIELAKKFLLPDIFSELGMESNIVLFKDSVLGYIISNFTNEEAGVRSLKRSLTRILSKLNVAILLGDSKSISTKILPNTYKFPLQITNTIVDQLLKTHEDNSKLTRIEMSMYM